jgi:hypothetical protein
VHINCVRETVRVNIKISAKNSVDYFELKKHKSWFDEECSELLDHRKQGNLQWVCQNVIFFTFYMSHIFLCIYNICKASVSTGSVQQITSHHL